MASQITLDIARILMDELGCEQHIDRTECRQCLDVLLCTTHGSATDDLHGPCPRAMQTRRASWCARFFHGRKVT